MVILVFRSSRIDYYSSHNSDDDKMRQQRRNTIKSGHRKYKIVKINCENIIL